MDGWQRRYRVSNGPGGLGVSCTVEGLALAGVPLLAKGAGGFQVRPAAEVAVLLKRAYGGAEPGATILPGLTKIADALNRGDLAQAMIRAVYLRLPDLDWDAAVRLARANDNLAKYSPDQSRDDHGRWTDQGGGAAEIIPSREGFDVKTNTQPQARGVEKKDGAFDVKAGTILKPKDAEKLFNDQIKELRAAGLLPTQSQFMGNLFPDFRFVPKFAVRWPDKSIHKFDSLKEAQRAASEGDGRTIIGGHTWGNYSEIYMTAAAQAEIPGLGPTSPEKTMRFVIMHEWGHQDQGGACQDNEACADNFSLHHQGADNAHR